MKSGKITGRGPGSRRRYDDSCAAAHALDLVGERWALLVMRELMFGPRRFGDLRTDLPGLSANVLTQRLEGLEAAGILRRRRLPPPASAQVYELTPWGYESEPVFMALGRWASRSPHHDPTLPFSAASLMLSLRTMFAPDRARDVAMRVGFRFGAGTYLVRVGDGALAAARADLDAAEAVFAGTPPLVAAALYGGVPLDALAAGGLAVEGDRAVAERFLTLFPLPSKVGTEA
ncbi:MAG: helix-turn-helix domain-containing protein [Methylobacterium frigidaeris]